MSNNFALFASIAARSFTGWLKIFVPGFLLSLAGIIAGLILFGGHNTAGVPAAGHAGGAGAVLGIFVLLLQNFWASLLLLVSIAGFAVYASLASKYGLQKAMYLAWENKLGEALLAKLSGWLDKIWPDKTAAPKDLPDATLVKSNLKQAVKQDTGTPRIGKRILNYALKKVYLDDIDFKNPALDFKGIIIQKIRDFISGRLEPSRKAFLVVAVLHILVFVLAIVLGR